MKKQISELLNEKFTQDPQVMQFSEGTLALQGPAGAPMRGTFSAASSTRGTLQGIVYSTHPRVTCSPQAFVGRAPEFSYEVDLTGLWEGDVVAGALVFCETGGAYQLPFSFTVQKQEAKEEERKADPISCDELARMAKEDFQKAYLLFSAPQFSASVTDPKDGWLALYEGLSEGAPGYHNLEQFLVGLGKKDPVTLRFETDSLLFSDVGEDVHGALTLVKDTWGFATLRAASDAPFLELERQEVSTEEFVGSQCAIGFVLRRAHMHAGRNFARVRVACGCREITCTVEARLPQDEDGRRERWEIQRDRARLLDAYVQNRTGKLGKAAWVAQSLSALSRLKKRGEDGCFYWLYRIYLLFLSDRAEDARGYLKEAGLRKEELAIPQWRACYQALTLYENRDKEHAEAVKREIQGLLLANRENWWIQWLVLYRMGGTFRNDTERLDAIRRQYGYGCASPVMYCEAAEILRKEPLMLRALGAFEVHLLGFLCKNDLLHVEICGQAAMLAAREEYQPMLVLVLQKCYKAFPSKNLLFAICSLLIKGRKTDAACAAWYRMGIEEDLRLAGLYEAYAQAEPDLAGCALPQNARLYFAYNNTLDCDKKAAIYANILRTRKAFPETYEAYRQQVGRFVEEQLAQGRVSNDLAKLYKDHLTAYRPTEEQVRELSSILYACEVTCQSPFLHQVAARHRYLPDAQRSPLQNGAAIVSKYGPGCAILLEGAELPYADKSLYKARMLMQDPALEALCRGAKEMPASLLLHDLGGEERITPQNAAQFVSFLSLSEVRQSARLAAQERLLSYFSQNPHDPALGCFLEVADIAWLAERDLASLSELLVQGGMAQTAYGLVCAYGPEHIADRTLVRLCSHCVSEDGERDDQLVSLCYQCFLRGLYEEKMLGYLMRWYEGPVETMKQMFAAGMRFSLEGVQLAERILTLVLLTRSGMEGTEEAYAVYKSHFGKSRICRAYCIWMSYCFFVREMPVADPVFDSLEQMMWEPKEPPVACQLALMRHYVGREGLTEGQEAMLYGLVEKYVSEGMYFRFYQKLPQRMLRRFHLHDKYILEYRGRPGSHVTLSYRVNGGKECVLPMRPMYEGICAHTVSLFYKDQLEWHVTEEHGRDIKRGAPQSLLCERRAHRGSTGKYELINRLSEAISRGDDKEMKRIRDQYVGQQSLVDALFQINEGA